MRCLKAPRKTSAILNVLSTAFHTFTSKILTTNRSKNLFLITVTQLLCLIEAIEGHVQCWMRWNWIIIISSRQIVKFTYVIMSNAPPRIRGSSNAYTDFRPKYRTIIIKKGHFDDFENCSICHVSITHHHLILLTFFFFQLQYSSPCNLLPFKFYMLAVVINTFQWFIK